MAYLNKVPTDYETYSFLVHMEQLVSDISLHATTPTFICGVNRRINTGNYEHLDIYAGLTLPVLLTPDDISDIEILKAAISQAAELGFGLASQETYTRYSKIKELQKSDRGPKS